MPQEFLPRRIKIVSEEPEWAAHTENYWLRMKLVKDYAPTGNTGWMGSVYFRTEEEMRPDFKANTEVYPERERALGEGTSLINQYQKELDDAMASTERDK